MTKEQATTTLYIVATCTNCRDSLEIKVDHSSDITKQLLDRIEGCGWITRCGKCLCSECKDDGETNER